MYFDIIILALFAAAIAIGIKLGFVRAGKNIIMNISTFLIMICLTIPSANIMAKLPVASVINNSVTEVVAGTVSRYSAAEGAQNAIYNLGFPDFITKALISQTDFISEAENALIASVSKSLTEMILNFIASISLFIITRIVLMLFSSAVDKILKIPVLDRFDKAAGCAMGIINALLIIYISCGLVMLFTPLDKQQTVNDFIQGTYVLRFFYENNYLLKIFI